MRTDFSGREPLKLLISNTPITIAPDAKNRDMKTNSRIFIGFNALSMADVIGADKEYNNDSGFRLYLLRSK